MDAVTPDYVRESPSVELTKCFECGEYIVPCKAECNGPGICACNETDEAETSIHRACMAGVLHQREMELKNLRKDVHKAVKRLWTAHISAQLIVEMQENGLALAHAKALGGLESAVEGVLIDLGAKL